MATIPLPSDFSAFLSLLQEHGVEYLLIGGYAVGYYGYVRATADMDLWVPIDQANAERLVSALQAFGFDVPDLKPSLFLKAGQVIRMGIPPMRIEIGTTISGVIPILRIECAKQAFKLGSCGFPKWRDPGSSPG